MSLSIRVLWLALASLCVSAASAHTIDGQDAHFIQENTGAAVSVFMYLGAKHMVTGYDHLLYLAGVVFFLYRPLHVVQYVTLFAVGHSITLLLGVLANLQVNAHLIDAIIGFSIVYKGFENIGGFKSLNLNPSPKIAVFIFGLIHGLGLATKLQEFSLSDEGLITNILSFNIGVELGQIFALMLIFLALSIWRTHSSYIKHALISNTVLMGGGFLLFFYQFAGFLAA